MLQGAQIYHKGMLTLLSRNYANCCDSTHGYCERKQNGGLDKFAGHLTVAECKMIFLRNPELIITPFQLTFNTFFITFQYAFNQNQFKPEPLKQKECTCNHIAFYLKLLTSSTQVPPFRQGALSHSLMLTSQLSPVKPRMQAQTYSPTRSSHAPPF